MQIPLCCHVIFNGILKGNCNHVKEPFFLAI